MIPEIDADEAAIAELAIANVRFGAEQERERIIKLIEIIQSTAMEEHGILEAVISAVKGEQVTTFGYEWINDRIKGENKASHTHKIEVFGAPCDCGTHHEYCGDCDWVEPCEPEGENK